MVRMQTEGTVLPEGALRPRAMATLFDRVGSWVTMLSASFLTLTVLGFCALWIAEVADSSDWRDPATAIGVTAVVAPLDLYFLILLFGLWSAEKHPLILAVAVRQRLMPIFLRPVVAGCWLMHFVGGAILIMSMEREEFRRPHTFLDLLPFVIFVAGITYAGNVFLMAGVAALTRNATVIQFMWRVRILVDLVVAVATPWIFGESMLIWQWIG